MRGDYLDVLHGAAAISVLVFEPRIGQLDVPILVWQLMLLRPSSDGIGPTIDSPSPLTVRTILGLKKPLILPVPATFDCDHSLFRLIECLNRPLQAANPAEVTQHLHCDAVERPELQTPLVSPERHARCFSDPAYRGIRKRREQHPAALRVSF